MKPHQTLLLAAALTLGPTTTGVMGQETRQVGHGKNPGPAVLELAQDRRGGPLLEMPDRPRGPRGPGRPGLDRPRRIKQEMLKVAGNVTVAADESVSDVVAVFGDALVDGEVRGDVVVAMGSAVINGPVKGDLVVAMGGARLGPTAEIDGDAIVVGGALEEAEGSVIRGNRQAYPLANLGTRVNYWFRSGLLMLRPLPPAFGIAWTLVLMHFLVYLVLTVLLPKPVNACVTELRLRAGPSFLVGVLALVLSVPLTFVPVATGVGLILIPFLMLLLTGAVFLGKAATLQHIGEQVGLRFGAKQAPAPLLALCIGSVLIVLVYMVPLLGLVAWGVLMPLAIGAVLLALAESFRDSGQPGGSVPSTAIPAGAGEVPPGSPDLAGAAVPLDSPEPKTAGRSKQSRKRQKSEPAEPAPEPGPASIDWTPGAACPGATNASSFSPAELAVMPRVGFWMRLMASFLDFILLLWVLPVAHRWFVPIWLAYHIGMWIWKGTTVGGIVCGLKVVRLDGRPVDFGVALVRALGSVFSFMALGIGFFWAGWMPERQSWHDRIAGTVIVKLPKGVSLV